MNPLIFLQSVSWIEVIDVLLLFSRTFQLYSVRFGVFHSLFLLLGVLDDVDFLFCCVGASAALSEGDNRETLLRGFSSVTGWISSFLFYALFGFSIASFLCCVYLSYTATCKL